MDEFLDFFIGGDSTVSSSSWVRFTPAERKEPSPGPASASSDILQRHTLEKSEQRSTNGFIKRKRKCSGVSGSSEEKPQIWGDHRRLVKIGMNRTTLANPSATECSMHIPQPFDPRTDVGPFRTLVQETSERQTMKSLSG